MHKLSFAAIAMVVAVISIGFFTASTSATSTEARSSVEVNTLSRTVSDLKRAIKRLQGSVNVLKGGQDALVLDERMCPAGGSTELCTLKELSMQLTELKKDVEEMHSDNVAHIQKMRLPNHSIK